MSFRDRRPRIGRLSPGLTWLVLAAGLVVPAGCENVSPYVPVQGTVRLDGRPLESGIVQFQPTSGQVAIGELGPGGEFSMATRSNNEGVLPGTYRVAVVAYAPAATEFTPENLIVPLRYTRSATSGLQVTIFPGSKTPVHLELVSDTTGNGGEKDEGGEPTASATPNAGADESADLDAPAAGSTPSGEPAREGDAPAVKAG